MKTGNLLYLTVCFCVLISCSEEEMTPTPSQPEGAQFDVRTSSNATVTGLTRFRVADMTIPSGGLPDAKQFYKNGLLRASTAYNPYGVTAVTKDGQKRVRFFINPTAPATYLTNTQYPYHHRAEFTRWPWWINHPPGTEEWLGFSYIFPTAAQGFTQNRTPVSIYQNHAGSRAGQTSNPPAFQLEIASPNQIQSVDPWKATPKGGEIMIINNIRKIRYVVPGVRVVAGARLDIVMQIIYGIGNKGVWNVWVNGKLVNLPVGNTGGTIWPAKLSTDLEVGGNSKLGLYHHFLRFASNVTFSVSGGHDKMEMFMTDWNDVIRHPGDRDYKNNNAYKAVSTASYP